MCVNLSRALLLRSGVPMSDEFTCRECGRRVPDHRDDCPIMGIADFAVRVLRLEILGMTHLPYRATPDRGDGT